MKIVYKNILINSFIAIVILFLGGLVIFLFLKGKSDTDSLEELYIQQNFIKKRLASGVDIDVFRLNMGDNVNVKETKLFLYKDPIIKDEKVYDLSKQRLLKIKKIIFDIKQSKQNYRISISKIIDKGEGIGESIGSVMLVSGIIMLTLLIVINIYVYYNLYSPFYKLMKSIGNFSVQKSIKIVPPKTDTEEFMILGNKISEMSGKMITDYNSIKEFIENMTHETQTPLAVINTKLERCLQDKNLTQEQAILLADAFKAVKNLFNLNKGLSLLSKLDNKQYNAPETISLKNLLEDRIEYFSDFMEAQEIVLTKSYDEDFTISIDKYLAEILIDNLLKNAVKHNFKRGKIFIKLQQKQLVVSNTGMAPTESTDRFFERFYSQNPKQSLGLGLSIIKKIIEYYSYTIVYEYVNDLHQISISFKNSSKNKGK